MPAPNPILHQVDSAPSRIVIVYAGNYLLRQVGDGCSVPGDQDPETRSLVLQVVNMTNPKGPRTQTIGFQGPNTII